MPHAESSFPPPPLESISWAALGSAVSEDNGHVESRYDAKRGTWTEPTFIKDPYIKVHGLAPGLNYGQQVYEGMKAYRSPTNAINIFRPQYHAARLNNSSSCVCIPPIPEEVYLRAVNLAVARNAPYVPPHSASALLYIRPVVFGSAANLGLTPASEYVFAVYTQPGNAYHGIKPMPAVVMEEFDRSAPRGTGGYKIGGNYAPCIRWQGKARALGYGLTLHLDSKTNSEIEEFSTSGFVGVRREADGRTTLYIPDSKNIVDSVTSDSIIKIAESLDWKVEKRRIHYTELRYLTEVLAVGTAASIVPIASIHLASTNEMFVFNHSGEGSSVNSGPVCLQLSERLLEIQKGVAEDRWGWRWEVTDPDVAVEEERSTDINEKLEKEVSIVEHSVENGNGTHGVLEKAEIETVSSKGHAVGVEVVENKSTEVYDVPEKGDVEKASTNGHTLEVQAVEPKTVDSHDIPVDEDTTVATVEEATTIGADGVHTGDTIAELKAIAKVAVIPVGDEIVTA